MNIFGEGFPTEIINEVTNRQKVYGSGYSSFRTENDIKYLNSNTSWCKLMSAVNIEDLTKLNNISVKNLGLSDNALAKKYVLFGGTAEYNGTAITASAGFGSNGAYGIGGTSEYGYRPMMGITGISVKHENRGSLRRAEVKIKANNKVQFEIIDVLYLRVGFFVLLEWGHSLRLNGGAVIDNDKTLINKFFNKGSDEYDDLLKLMQETRISSNGNYDAMLAKVSNFHWKVLPDGSYDITVDLVSIGDVIESLKANALISSAGSFVAGEEVDEDTQISELESEELIDLYASKSTIGSFLYFLRIQLSDVITTPRKETPSLNGDPGYYIRLTDLSGTTVKSQQKDLESEEDYSDLPLIDVSLFAEPNSDAYVIDWDNWGSEYYVRLGTFLKFIENSIVITANKKRALLKFDTEAGTNLMYVHPLQISTDPRVCMINKTLNINGRDYVYGNGGNEFLVTVPGAKEDYGDIMNIYLSSAFILKKLDELKDDQNKVVLIDFIKGLLQSVNSSLGGVNDLDVFIDETDNSAKIIDKNPLPDLDSVIDYINSKTKYPKLEKKPAEFIIQGHFTQGSGFVRSFDFTTEMNSQFSTMVTVAAAANSAVVGENDTALSKINLGLGDRWKNEVTNGNATVPTTTGDNLAELQNRFKETFDKLAEFLRTLSPSAVIFDAQELNPEEIDAFKDTLTSVIQMDIQIDKLKNKTPRNFGPGSGFIPFNLSLTIDGLSGMKINQKFIVESSFLPSNYPDSLIFLIKNISHTVENNKWITKLESYAVSSGDGTSKSKSFTSSSKIKKKPPVISGGGGGGGGGGPIITGSLDKLIDDPDCYDEVVKKKRDYGYYGTVSASLGIKQKFFRTITSGHCANFKLVSSTKPQAKKQIFLHHTGGWQKNDKGNGVIQGWNGFAVTDGKGSNRWAPSSPYILGGDGHVEQLGNDQWIWNTQRPDDAWKTYFGDPQPRSNYIGIGIEIENWGWVHEVGGKWYSGDAGSVGEDMGQKPNVWTNGFDGTGLRLGNGISEMVDWDLNVIPEWKGHQYGQEYAPAQITSLKKLLTDLIDKYLAGVTEGNIENGKFKWKGKETYQQIFPDWDKLGTKNQSPAKGTTWAPKNLAGIYTHDSVTTQKSDSMPTLELVKMLIELGS